MANELKTTLELDIKPFLDAIKRAANNLRVLEDLRPRINVNELQRNLQTAFNQISSVNPEINVGLNIDTRELAEVESQINGVAEDPIRVDLLVNSEEIQTSLNRVRDLRQTAISIPPQTKLDVDSNAEEVQSDIGKIKTEVAGLTSVNNVIKFSVEEGEIQQQIKAIEDSIKGVRDLAEGQILPISLEIEPPTGEAKQLQRLDKLKERLNEIDAIKATPEIDTKEVEDKIDGINRTVKSLSDARVGISTTGVDKTNQDLNKVEKETRDIPRNVKINVQATGAGAAKKALSGASGFAGQLGSGLLASFSGAAIGAAIAGFATQAVRGIGQAVKTADELQDSLILAFTQAGVADIEEALQRANVFALDLSNNFGISAERSKTLLSQVVGLTGEFGSASENITKAAIGIESATGGLVKAEQAAKLFSRSIGNPEDQAALETLAKRFPAIGDAILGATEPAEKANAVIANLSGTFAALNEDSQDLFSTLQRLGDTFSTVFGTAFAPIADSLAPVFQRISDSLLENTDSIAAFGDKVVTSFIEPLLDQLEKLGPSFDTFLNGLTPILGVISGISFDILITSLQILDPLLQAVGSLFTAISPLLQKLGDIISGVLAPVFQLFNNELYNSLDPTKQLTDNVFTLAPIMETLSNIVSLLNPVLNLLGNILIATVIPALQGLEYVLGVVLLPFRALNFAFDVGAKFAADYGDQISRVATAIQNYIFPLIPPLFVASKLLGVIFDYANKPINFKADLGDLSKIGNLPADLFGEQYNSAKKFEEQLGVKLPKAIINFGKGFGGGGKSQGTKSAEQELSALQKLIAEYDKFGKLIEERGKQEVAFTEIAIKKEENLFGRRLTATEKFYRAQAPLERQQERLNQLQEEFAKILGTTPNQLALIAQEYLKTGNAVTSLPIKIDTKDPQAVKDAEALVQRLLDLVSKEVETQTQQQELNIQIKEIGFDLDREVISTQFDQLETFIGDSLDALRFGEITLFEFDTAGIRRALESIKQSAELALVPFDDKIKSTNKVITILREDLDKLKTSGQTNTKEFELLQNKLRLAQDGLDVLTKQSEVYRNTIRGVTQTQRTFGDTLQQTISDRAQRIATDLQRLTDAQDVEITIDLNAEGVNQGLIEIERNFLRSINEIQTFYAQAIDRLKVQQGGQLLEGQAEKLAEAQKNILRTLTAQNQISIDDLRLQNDAVFAITQALGNNLGNAFVPNSINARKGLDDRQKQIDSQLDLLRVNLDAELQLNKDNLQLRTLSYQEYTEKVLELEKEKSESIKQYEEEVSQARLQALQKIADEALPAIQNQLRVANAELTLLFKDSTANFEDIAEKGLETIGLVAAQSLALAIQQAQSLEDIQKIFLRNLASGILKLLRIQLEAAILQALFKEIAEKSFAGIITGAIISGVLVGLFAAAEAKILSSIGGFESGGYTGEAGTKQVVGVVHGQEFVLNARATKGNRDLLEWLNKGNSADSFFDRKPSELKVNNFVDTKALNASINGLAYTMDVRLSSMERTLDSAITKNASTVRTANQVDVSVYSDPGTSIKYMKKMGKIKGLT